MHTFQQLNEWLLYRPATGAFVWKKTRSSKAVKGQLAGTLTEHGYVRIGFGGRFYLAHRLTFLFKTKRWPVAEIDHINCLRWDNRWANLREATRTENAQNQLRAMCTSKLGVLGVSAYRSRFKAQITVQKKQVHLGVFATVEEASAAYKEAKRKLHSNQ